MENKVLSELQRKIERDFDVYQTKFQDMKKAQDALVDIKQQQDDLNVILAYFNKLVDKKKREVMDKVVGVVSSGLKTVFDDETMELKVNERIQRNQKIYSISIVIDGVETEDWNAASGGVRNVVVFMLRVVFLAISSNRKFLALDEPFPGLSTEYRENLALFLRTLAEKFNMQFLIVSHQAEIDVSADKLYEIRRINGQSVILPVEIKH